MKDGIRDRPVGQGGQQDVHRCRGWRRWRRADPLVLVTLVPEKIGVGIAALQIVDDVCGVRGTALHHRLQRSPRQPVVVRPHEGGDLGGRDVERDGQRRVVVGAALDLPIPAGIVREARQQVGATPDGIIDGGQPARAATPLQSAEQ